MIISTGLIGLILLPLGLVIAQAFGGGYTGDEEESSGLITECQEGIEYMEFLSKNIRLIVLRIDNS